MRCESPCTAAHREDADDVGIVGEDALEELGVERTHVGVVGDRVALRSLPRSETSTGTVRRIR